MNTINIIDNSNEKVKLDIMIKNLKKDFDGNINKSYLDNLNIIYNKMNNRFIKDDYNFKNNQNYILNINRKKQYFFGHILPINEKEKLYKKQLERILFIFLIINFIYFSSISSIYFIIIGIISSLVIGIYLYYKYVTINFHFMKDRLYGYRLLRNNPNGKIFHTKKIRV